MIFNIEVVGKGYVHAVVETVVHDGRDAPAWTEEDVAAILKEILGAIDRVANPGADQRPVTLRGFSWIVEPSDDQVVVAVEIPSGAAVAGPFDIDQAHLSQMITRVIEDAGAPLPGSSRIH